MKLLETIGSTPLILLESLSAGLFDYTCFKRRADDSVKPCVLCRLRIVHHNFPDRLLYKQIPLHRFLISACKLGDGDKQRTGAVLSGKPFDRGLHHCARAGSVEIRYINVKL